jgi:hypothetical protein
MIKILDDTKVYVWTPAKVATGGPEALHQLVYNLRNSLGINAFIFYVNLSNQIILDPVHENYKKYNNPYVFEIEDNSKNILIVPEMFQAISIVNNFKKIRILIWWLSLDNYYIIRFSIELGVSFEEVNRNPYFAIRYYQDVDLTKDEYLKKAICHMAQSVYVQEHLINKGFSNVVYLSEYLNEDFLNENFNRKDKRDIVLYNPAKGMEFTSKIINIGHFRYIPISNRNRKQIIYLLEHAKVYIDFGNFPGKDRIPREAVIMGCCIITGKKGSAYYFADLPISDEYKFEDKEENIPLIADKIQDCFYNFEKNIENFINFRNIIKQEHQKFIQDLQCIFNKR